MYNYILILNGKKIGTSKKRATIFHYLSTYKEKYPISENSFQIVDNNTGIYLYDSDED